MTLLKDPLPGLCIVALSLLHTGATLAQDERWFKIELLVFSHESASTATSETWDPSPELAYPNEFRFLVDPESVAANLANHDATGIVNEFGRQILTINPPLFDDYGDLLPFESEDALEGIPLLEVAVDANEVVAQDTGDDKPAIELPLEAEPLPLTPTPFTALAGSAMEFRGKAAYMRRTGRYQILFHEVWVQPVASEARALPIVLDRSGDTQDWPRLQGSVKVYLARFLHMETKLWLNTMGPYFPESWQIPPAPLGPQSLIIEYPELPETLLDLYPPDAEPTEPAELPEPDEVGLEGDPEAEIPLATGPVYPWRHAVVLQQKRKMRSTEVHYIDHPLLGVVVLILPVTDEELEAMAATVIQESIEMLQTMPNIGTPLAEK